MTSKKYKFNFKGIFILAVFLMGEVFLLSNYYSTNKQTKNELIESGFLPIRQAINAFDYEEIGEYFFSKTSETVLINVRFDLSNSICIKNNYSFDISDSFIDYENEIYIYQKKLESIINAEFYFQDDCLKAIAINYSQHDWITASAPLVAHALGGLRESNTNSTYQNTLEALIQNYELGHRVFEVDFQVTSDYGLAAVHDGLVPGNENGIYMSDKEWKSFQDFNYTTLLVGDILDEMLINTDMFIVTDTKWLSMTAFDIIYQEAQKKDPALMDRIIPQIYEISMYDKLMNIYSFPSVIYTTYASSDTNEEIVEFVASKDNIRVITTPGTGRIDEGLLQLANDNDILIFVHTYNTYTDMTRFLNMGVYGIYTDYLIPGDYNIYKSLSENIKNHEFQ